MEWVETTGKSVEEAVERALDQLGVDEADAEFEVLSEAKVGLFGRLKSEARIRARVRPTQPRPKDGGNQRNRRRNGRDRHERPKSNDTKRAPAAASSGSDDESAGSDAVSPVASADEADNDGDQPTRSNRNRNRRRRKPASERTSVSKNEGAPEMDTDVAMERQGEVASEFLEGLLAASGINASLSTAFEDDGDTVVVSVEGDNLGHFIGPRGTTLQSVQELTRTAVQRRTGARNGRIVVDFAHYREKRRAALERFTAQIADEVKSSGEAKTLEPMHPADRKIVHDVINSIDGVETTSEGEEPRRRVVVRPAGG